MKHDFKSLRRMLCHFTVSFLLVVSSTVLADTNDDIKAKAQKWLDTISTTKRDADAMAKLYATDAVFWGTSSSVIRTTPELVREYFAAGAERAAKRQAFKVTIEEPRQIQIYGDIAIMSGRYVVHITEDGKTRTVPLRFTFVYAKRDGEWIIVNHHSSRMPK